MLPKLWLVKVMSCREFRHFSKCEGEEERVISVVSPDRIMLDFSECNLSDDSVSLCISSFPNLTLLDLSFNTFTILPACIKECHFLRGLYVQYCKQLRQIEGMPPNLKTFNATDCTSLTSLASSILLHQAFHGPGSREFILPGQNVPEWFHHYRDGESMCFWVCNEFPVIAVCAVFGGLDDRNCKCELMISVRINGIGKWFNWYPGFLSTLGMDHVVLFDLQRQLHMGELQKLLLQDQWNHVEVLWKNASRLERNGVMKWNGVYIYPQENSMENIRFSRPSSLRRTYHDSHNDLELDCYPLMKKHCTYLDMGVSDRELLDIQQQRGLAFTLTGSETSSNHERKDLLANNDSSELLSLHPCWQEPLDPVNWDSNSMKSMSTSDTITHQGLQEQQQYLTCSIKQQQNDEGCGSVNEAEGNGMVACNNNDGEDNSINSSPWQCWLCALMSSILSLCSSSFSLSAS